MTASGRWEGKLVDATGPAARVDLSLTSQGGKVRGDFSATFLPPTDVSCGPSAPRLVARGVVEGTEDDNGGLSVRTKLDSAGTTIAVQLDVAAADADPHAKRALLGTFQVLEGADVLTMQGGSTVLWDYGAKRKRGE